MSDNEKELVDLDKEGKIIDISDEIKSESEKSKKLSCSALIIMIFISLIIILFGAIFIYLSYLRTKNFILIITEDSEEISKAASEIISNFIKKKPNCILGLITGDIPKNTYKYLVKKYENKEISFENVITYNLDEYIELNQENEKSNYYQMKKNLFDHINIKNNNINIFNVGKNSEKEILNFQKKLENIKINLQFLEIGKHGQIGFNEPGTLFNSTIRLVNITDKDIIKKNFRFFNNDISKVPKKIITMGIHNILSSENILVIANGYKKATAIKKLVKGYVDINWPCTSLNGHKGKVYVIIDKEAASEL